MTKLAAAVTFLITLLTALPSHAGLYSKDLNLWEGKWELSDSGRENSGTIDIQGCKDNVCRIDAGVYHQGPMTQDSCEFYGAKLSISGAKASLTALGDGQTTAKDNNNKDIPLAECVSLRLNEEKGLIELIISENCLPEAFCSKPAKASLHSGSFKAAHFLATKDRATHKASYKCEDLTKHMDILICTDKELASLDSELNEAYKYAKDSGKDNASSQKDWLKKRDLLYSHDNAKEKIARSYADRIYELQSRAPYKAPAAESASPNDKTGALAWIGTGSVAAAEKEIPNEGTYDITREITIDNCKGSVCELSMTIYMSASGVYSGDPAPAFSATGVFTPESPDKGTAKNLKFTKIYSDTALPLPELKNATCALVLEHLAATKEVSVKAAPKPACILPEYLLAGLGAAKREAVTFYAPGYDCSKASTIGEKAVCTDKTLASLDMELTTLYKKTSASKDVKAGQKAWMARKNACGADKNCLGYEYKRRIIELYKALRASGAKK
ncbi:MAG: lysozyme inhibitor LprI family protein [Deltaproteobacteria bacterium]|nr:lysozyme inhibitor LprI family protein [Deltaproteobacteria bacterium]